MGKTVNHLSPEACVLEIIAINKELSEFWPKAHGWAPDDAAELLSKSRLDWQVSLSYCLHLWLTPNDDESIDGRLILAWANLGSLVEGTMKFFLSVYYEDYKRDGGVTTNRKELVDPDSLMFDRMRQFFDKVIWGSTRDWNTWVLNVQQKRNAIHAYRDRDIGTFEEFHTNVRRYLQFLQYHYGRLPPYPCYPY